MPDHDPRIVALAKDHRTGPQWRRLITVGFIGGSEKGFLPFARACHEHGLDDLQFETISAELLAYVRSVADEIAETADDRALALSILRDNELTTIGHAVMLVLETKEPT